MSPLRDSLRQGATNWPRPDLEAPTACSPSDVCKVALSVAMMSSATGRGRCSQRSHDPRCGSRRRSSRQTTPARPLAPADSALRALSRPPIPAAAVVACASRSRCSVPASRGRPAVPSAVKPRSPPAPCAVRRCPTSRRARPTRLCPFGRGWTAASPAVARQGRVAHISATTPNSPGGGPGVPSIPT